MHRANDSNDGQGKIKITGRVCLSCYYLSLAGGGGAMYQRSGVEMLCLIFRLPCCVRAASARAKPRLGKILPENG